MNSKIFAKLSLSALFFLNTQTASQISKEKFLKAARYGNTATIQSYIDQGGDVNAQDMKENTALHFAANYGNADALKLLLEHGVSIDKKDKYGSTALHSGALFNNTDFIKLLLEHGASIDIQDNSGNTPLHCIAFNNIQTDTLELLLNYGASINKKDNNGWTSLHWATIWSGGSKSIKTLVRWGANCKIQDNNKKTPFDIAIQFNNSDTAKTLLREGLIHDQYNINEVEALGIQLVNFNLLNKQDLLQEIKTALEIKNKDLTTSVINPFVILLRNDPTNQEQLKKQASSIKNKILLSQEEYQNLQDLNKRMRDEDKVERPVPSLQLLCAGFIAKEANFDK